jgi:hypothetical protein
MSFFKSSNDSFMAHLFSRLDAFILGKSPRESSNDWPAADRQRISGLEVFLFSPRLLPGPYGNIGKEKARVVSDASLKVEPRGIEPLTSALRTLRSPS